MNQPTSSSTPPAYGGWSVLVISDGDTAALAAAVSASGAQTGGRWRLGEAIAADALPASTDAVLVDLTDAGERAADAVAVLARLVDDRAAAVVAAVDADTVDMVAATWLGAPHALVLDGGPADIGIALVNARLGPGTRAGVASDEAERLRQLNSEVARIAEALARLTRGDDTRERPMPGVRAKPVGFGMPPIEAPAAIDARDVRNLIRARRMREAHFAGGLFADPAWDMLLDLFAAGLEHRRVSVSSLCIAAAVPGTTALRWIGTMVDAGLFERQDDPLDRRRAYIVLTDRAREAMTAYLESVQRAGLHAG